jgi:hypothetical protein
MPEANQVRNLATLAIEKHGLKAPSFARRRALEVKAEGDAKAAATWFQVAELADQILRDPIA